MINPTRISIINKEYAIYRQKDKNKDGQINPDDTGNQKWNNDPIKKLHEYTNNYIKYYKQIDQQYQDLVRMDINQNGSISDSELQIADSIAAGDSTQALTLINNKLKKTQEKQLIKQYQNKINDVYNYFGRQNPKNNKQLDIASTKNNIIEELSQEYDKYANNQYFSAENISNLYVALATLNYLELGKHKSDKEACEIIQSIINDLDTAIKINPLNHNAQTFLALVIKQYTKLSPLEEKLVAQAEYTRSQLPEINYLNNIILKDKKTIYEKLITANIHKFKTAEGTICFLEKAVQRNILKKEDIALFLHVLFNKKFKYTTTNLDKLIHPNDFFKAGKGVCDEWSYAFHYIIQALNKKCALNIEAELIAGKREGNIMGHMFCLFKDPKGRWRSFQENGIGNDYYNNKVEALLQIKDSGLYTELYILNNLDQGTERKRFIDSQRNILFFYKIK